MKKFICLMQFIATSLLFGQYVGINTDSPTTSLEVRATLPTGNNTKVEGFLVPRVDRQRAQSMGTSVPQGNLIFVNDISTGTATAADTTTNVTSVGLYYFDTAVSKWVKLNTGAVNNIYSSDGTLSGNRTVNQNGNVLTFINTGNFTTFTGGTVMFLSGIIKNYKELTSSTQSLGITDYTLYKQSVTSDITFGLPSSQNGREICLSNIATSGNIYVLNVGPSNASNQRINTITPGSGKCYHFVGRSQEWLPLSSNNPAIRSFSGTVTDGDYTILGTGDITLPSANSGNIGKVYNFIYDGTSYSVIGDLRWNGGDFTSYGLNSGNSVKSITVQSNGSRWVVIATSNL